MKRILFMPFLKMSSGHHQVANGLIDTLQETNGMYEYDKVDILSYTYGQTEAFISNFYIKWIDHFPGLYSWLYMKSAYKHEYEKKRFYLYEWLFLYSMEKLIKEKNPQLIICTHAMPSYLLSHLKQRGEVTVPVINVYTDYFINQIWGIEAIDYHFVPNKEIKDVLIGRGVKEDHVLLTGIPIHPHFKKKERVTKSQDEFAVMVSGGSLGTGLIKTFVETLQPAGNVMYKVLCGKNEKLYDCILKMNHPYILPVPYISSKVEMNELYDTVDPIITKPGGVTVSECLYKKVPIFVYHELPGQEQINLINLKRWGLVHHLDNWREIPDLEDEITRTLRCEKQKELRNLQFENYHQQLSQESVTYFIEELLVDHVEVRV